jgi:protoheme IX farnesyltransferase
MIRWLNILRELTKLRISLFVTLSACAGFILANGGVSGELLSTILGIFFLSCGSCALNQYQEREMDARMERTKGRPLPAGKLDPTLALLVSSGLIVSGGSILFLGASVLACGLGLFAILWYNGVYLYLKRTTTFAILPGALIGAIPPAIGWVSGGGSFLDPRLGAIAFFFFNWQVPHFWLLLLEFAVDYERAGLPSLAKLLTAERLTGITFIWILSTAVSCLLIPLFLQVHFPFILISLLATTLWLVWSAASFLRFHSREGYLKYAFVRLNIYAFFVLSLLSLDRLLDAGYPEGNMLSKIFSAVFKLV